MTHIDSGSAPDRSSRISQGRRGWPGRRGPRGREHGKFSLAPIAAAQARGDSPPKLSEQKWWPSKWGADDQAGASNHITPQKVLDTVKWIKDGKIYKLGHNYDSTMPLLREAHLHAAHSR